MTPHFDTKRHPITDDGYVARCRERLAHDGALVLRGFARASTIERIVTESAPRETNAFYAGTTHNVYLTPSDPALPDDHPYNRQVESSKGLIADDEIPTDSPLREMYDDASFRMFLCGVLGIDAIHPYADDLSSINVHFAAEGMELGWHFDNSSFAVTMLLQAAEGGAHFEHVPAVRDADAGDMAFDRVGTILAGGEPVQTLDFEPGDLVLFRGRNAIHRVTPTTGNATRLLVVFAYNDQPGVTLSTSARSTFYGRTG
ncbi:2OG-Fe(II) oxygenase [Ilumatobacter sp.]|nr:2OG-Fe(II) oxygenase [Ilumatobacter sp.]